MKIGILSSYFYPVSEGAENVILNQARELAKNHEVHVFTTNRFEEKIFKKEEVFEGIKIHRVPVWFRYKYYLAFYPRIIKELLKYDLDILHVNSLGFLQHDLAVLIKKLIHSKTKLICTPHGVPLALEKYSLPEKILKALYIPISKFVNKFYSYFIEVNPYSYEIFKEFGIQKEKLKLIPNAGDNEIFLSANKKVKGDLIKKYSLQNKFIITYLGRIQEYKGLDQIIEILPKLDKKNKIVFMAIGSDARDKERLQELAKKLRVGKKVIFTGRVSEEEKKALLELSEVFVFPSRDEMFGISLIEAMAKGNAVVSTRTLGGRYLVKKENGFLYTFGNISDLKKKINILINDNKLRKQMQKNNSKKAKEFTWTKSTKKLLNLYKEVLNEN